MESAEGDRLDVGVPYPTKYDDGIWHCDNGSVKLAAGRLYAPCAYVSLYDSITGYRAPADNEQWIEVRDACGRVIYRDYSYDWHMASDPSYLQSSYTYGDITIVPTTLPAACYGEWVMTFTFREKFTSGAILTDSESAVINVPLPIPGQAQALAQSYGGSVIHAHQADPVDTFTGALNHTDGVDMMLAALGADLVMARSYASNDPTAGPLGVGWTFSYQASVAPDASSGDVTYHDPSGSQQVFTPNASGGFVTPPGARSQLSKNADGTFTMLFKDQTRFEFAGSGRLVAIRDRNSQGSDLTYNTAGQLAEVRGSGRALAFGYDATTGLITSVTSSDGRVVSYGYIDGRLSSYTNAEGKTTNYGYDAGGRLNSVQDPNGNYPVRLSYDAVTGRAVQQLDPNGAVTYFGWDPATNIATTTDARGKVWSDEYVNGYLFAQKDPLNQATYYGWHDDGSLARVTDAVGRSTAFGYDAAANLTQRSALPNTAREETKTEQYAYNARNDLTVTTDFNAVSTTYTYDAAGNLTSTVRPDVTTGASITASSHTYNPNGTVATTTNATGKTTSFTYNTAGDLTSVTDPVKRKTTYTYDAAGRRTSVVDPRGNVTGANPDTYRTSYTYDRNNRLLSVSDPLKNTARSEYDAGGRLVVATDARNKATTYTYDAANHLKTVQGPDPAIPPVVFDYDPNGNVTTRTDSRGKITSYLYDDANRQLSVTSPAGTWSYTYYASGALASQTAPSGRQVGFARNRDGHVASMRFSDGTPTVSYTYDANGNRKTMTDAAGQVTYAYNVLNQVTSATRAGEVYNYTYDNDGRLLSRTPPGLAADSFSWDDAGRLAKVMRAKATLASYTYDDATGRATTALKNAVSVTRDIDAAGRISEIKGVKRTTVLAHSTYTRDPNGNPTAVVDQTGATTSYTYDDLDRLTSVCYQSATCNNPSDYIRWTYDANDNRTSETRPTGVTTYTYDDANRLTTRTGLAGNATYTYDRDGNLTTDGTTSYTWNAAGHMLTTTTGATTMSYSYDGDNRRTKSVTGASTVNFQWDPLSNDLTAERDGAGSLLRRYAYGDGLLGYTAGNADYYYLLDALGSVRAVTDSRGAATANYTYEPYGLTKTSTQSSVPNPLQFTGNYNDGSLYHLRARQYDPKNGVFTSADPVGTPGTGYGYTNANPMTANDPLGLYGWDSVHAWAGGVAAVAGVVALVCTVAVVCAPVVAVAAPLALAATAVAAATTNSALACISGKVACGGAVVGAAMFAAGGKYGLGKVGTAVSGQVGYGSTALSTAVQQARRDAKDRGGNYAAGQLEDGTTIIGRSGALHAEQDVIRQAGGRRITDLYSEREPCAHKCAALTKDMNVSWSWPWNPAGVRADTNAAIRNAIGELFQ